MPKPDRLVQVWRRGHGLPFPFYRDVTGSQRSFDSLSLGGWDFLDLGRGEHPERVTAIYVTPEIFRVTAEPMVLGRFYAEDEDRHGGPPVVVLSEQLWREKFDGGPNIVGKTIVLSDQTFEIIGVCHRQVESFSTPYQSPLYVPLHVGELFGDDLTKPAGFGYLCFGRLRDGVSPAQAESEIESFYRSYKEQYPEVDKGYRIQMESILEGASGYYAETAWLLEGAMGCLLLISCANVSSLLLAKVSSQGGLCCRSVIRQFDDEFASQRFKPCS
jgi:putative ABC transport system permease protein